MRLICGDEDRVDEVNTDRIYNELVELYNMNVEFIRCIFLKGLRYEGGIVKMKDCKFSR